MPHFNKAMLGLALAATTLTSACVTDPVTGEKRVSRAAIGGGIGAVGGYLLGDLVGGKRGRRQYRCFRPLHRADGDAGAESGFHQSNQ